MARPWSNRSRGRRQQTAAPDLTADDVRLVYRAVLGRGAGDDEVAAQLAACGDLRGLLRSVASSEEHRQRAAAVEAALAAGTGAEPQPAPATPPRPRLAVNVHTDELAGFGIPPGTWSDDETAVVGHDGWLFLGRGNNLVLAQYRGEVELPEDWIDVWADAVTVRQEGAAAIGADLVGFVVPDKLTVMRSAFPEDLPDGARPPAALLAARADLGLLYPVEALRSVPGGAFLRADTHLRYEGTLALARQLCGAVGVDLPAHLDAEPAQRRLISGDLGSRFDPAVVEVQSIPGDLGIAELVESNHPEISAVGGHVGTRQVLRSPSAPDPRTVVVFGDSYAFCAPYFPGLAWFLAQVFREVHFLWAPFGWDPGYLDEVRPDVVVCECAERFVVRPPLPTVDVRALAEQTLQRRRGITLDELDA